MTNNDKLRDIMTRHRLSRRRVAELLGKPLSSSGGRGNSTVDAWLSGRNPCPDWAVELLRYKLGEQ